MQSFFSVICKSVKLLRADDKNRVCSFNYIYIFYAKKVLDKGKGLPT